MTSTPLSRVITCLLACLLALSTAGCVAETRTVAPPPRPAQEPSAPDSPSEDPAQAATPTVAPKPDAAGNAPQVREGTVVRVVDGDTAHIVIDGVREKVRFIGIDTPESTREREPFGKEASNRTKQALDGRRVWVETDAELRDRYGRLLAYIWLERPRDDSSAEARAKMLNARLVADGFAQIYTFPPNVKYVDVFLSAQREARQADRGLWAVPGAADPLTGRRAESP